MGTRKNFTVPGGATFDTSTLFIDDPNNRVGIVTVSPQYTLDVSGVVRGSSGVIGLTTAGAPSGLAAGAFAVDTTNNTFYYRTTTNWLPAVKEVQAVTNQTSISTPSPGVYQVGLASPANINISGNANLANAWTTPRTVTFTGDVTGSFTISGAADVSNVALSIAANSVVLGTDTTGTYVSSIAASGVGLSVTGSGTESAAVTITSNATSDNTASTLVSRDASGNFSAGTITAALSGNATTATTLATARTINGVSFDGSANITVAAAAGTLTGSTLASGVTASSLTSVGTIDTLTTSGLTSMDRAYITSTSTTVPILRIQNASGQTADMTQWRGSGGTTVSSVDVNGRFYVSNGSNSTPSYSFTNDGDSGMWREATNDARIGSNGTWALAAIAGEPFIRAITTAVTTTVRHIGLGALGVPSSKREMKDDIEDLTGDEALNVIGLLQPRKFVFRRMENDSDDVAALRPLDVQYGFIAEEVADVSHATGINVHESEPPPLPQIPDDATDEEAAAIRLQQEEMIRDLDNYVPSYWKEPHMISLLVAAVKHLAAEVNALKAVGQPD